MRNATKVAFGSLVMGCGGAMTTTTEPDAQADAKTKVDASVLDVVVPSDATLACTGPTDVDASDVSSETFACCLGTIRSETGDASPWSDPNGPDASALTSDPAALNCCNAIIAHMDNEPDGGDLSADWVAAGDALNWCCIALNYPMGPACTPWGPPTPPEMPGGASPLEQESEVA